MIDQLGAAPAHGSIKLPALVQPNRVNPPRLARPEHLDSAAQGFPLVKPLTGILNDPLARGNRLSGEHAKPFDARASNAQLEIRKLRVDSVEAGCFAGMPIVPGDQRSSLNN